jgi:hypothetical protein
MQFPFYALRGCSFLGRGALVAAGCLCFAGVARGQRARTPPSVVAQVYVQVDAPNRDGVGFLSKRHFSLSAAGKRLSFVLSSVTTSRRTGAPTPQNYLLVLLPPFPPAEMKEPCHEFASVLTAGWSVELLDPSASQTDEIPCGTGARQRVIRVVRGPEMDAVKQLSDAHGRRLVLFLTSQTHVLDPALQKIANDVGAMVYDVGGSETYFVDEQTYAPVNIPFAQMQSGPQPGPYFVARHGVAKPERSVSAALRDSMQGARGFYVLTTELPGPTDVLSLRLTRVPSGLTVAGFVSVEDGEAPRLEIVH